MADHSKHEHGCGCGGKTKARQQVEPDFTLDPISAKAIETACCGHNAAQDQSADHGCCGGSRAKQPKVETAIESSARRCCGGHGHD